MIRVVPISFAYIQGKRDVDFPLGEVQKEIPSDAPDMRETK